MPAERIQKMLARSGLASRRGAESLIATGASRSTAGWRGWATSADPGADAIAVDGAPCRSPAATVHLAVHKPTGSSRRRRTSAAVARCVSLVDAGGDARLWPAGRLDVDSEGLMVLTNDGEWANRMLHPRYGDGARVRRAARACPTAGGAGALLDGVELDDGPARLLAASPAPPPAKWRATRRARPLAAAAGRRGAQARGAAPLRGGGAAGRAAGPHPARPAHHSRPARRGVALRCRGRGATALAGARTAASADRGRGAESRWRWPSTGRRDPARARSGYALAQRIGATFVDTGLMYRALTLAALERGIDPTTARRWAGWRRRCGSRSSGRATSRTIAARRCCSTAAT